MVRILLTIFMTAAVIGCGHADMKGLLMPTGDGVDSRFEQSARINEDLNAAVLESDRDYAFYVAADPHVDQTHANLTVFNDSLRGDADALFGVILGDCTDIRDNLPRYLEALSFESGRHMSDPKLFHVLGNHDVFFKGWEDFKKMIGASVYWFEVVFPNGKDLYITLDTATGTLGRKQTEWFREFLEENRGRYRHCVIFTHTNFFYTDNSQTGSGNMPIEESFSLVDLLARQNVSLVLQGHDHYREELVYGNVIYTVLGAIADKSSSPEYLKVIVTSEGICLDWKLIK